MESRARRPAPPRPDGGPSRALLRNRLQAGCAIRLRSADPNLSHKGTEIRIHATDRDQAAVFIGALKDLGIKPGKPYAKRRAWVIPVYGAEAVEQLLALLGGARARAALKRIEARPRRGQGRRDRAGR